jgi:hypothetical protein
MGGNRIDAKEEQQQQQGQNKRRTTQEEGKLHDTLSFGL